MLSRLHFSILLRRRGERRMLDKARRLLVQEIAIAKEVITDDVEDELNQIFAC